MRVLYVGGGKGKKVIFPNFFLGVCCANKLRFSEINEERGERENDGGSREEGAGQKTREY